MPASILVVDDERSIVDTVSAIFQRAGYWTRCAYSGDEAIAIASECRPDLLLCDVMMPSLNGLQTALRIKKSCPACRILLFSGHMAAAILLRDSAQAFTDSGYRFELLAKPINPRILLHKVQEALQAGS
jgi:CheY-like chemotaxis protein